jgi:hypothetical protein
MSDLKIELDVPIPTGGSRGHGMSGALRDLSHAKIGASILFPDVTKHTMRALTARISKETNSKFCLREVDGGVRVWRLL